MLHSRTWSTSTSPCTSTSPNLWRIWELRHAISAYDATYVALAEALQAELVTCDGRLARAGGHHANVSVIE